MADFLRTDDVAEAERFDQWRHWISATFVPLECAQVSRAAFHGEAGHWELGEMLVSRVAADPHLAARTRRAIAVRDVCYDKVGLLDQGLRAGCPEEGREALLRPGDLAIDDCRRPYTMAFGERHEMSFLMFPCDLALGCRPPRWTRYWLPRCPATTASVRWSPRSWGGWSPTSSNRAAR